MITINPFAEVSQLVPSIVMQAFIVLMVILVVVGTFFEMLHKKNVTYFFQNAKKAKQSATKTLGVGKKTSIVIKTVATDVLTTAELGAGQRRIAHVLGMWGTILFWATSVIMIFCYSTTESETPLINPLLWHLGAIMTCIGGYWFWFFLRVDVSAEGFPWYRFVRADLFVLSLIITATLGLIWSYLQSKNIDRWETLFLILFGLSNLVLFGGIYWSKFALMFYKPGAAIQKHLAEADGSNENLPYPTDNPKQFGLGIKRDAPKHY